MTTTPIREEVNDDDQDTSDQAPTELRRSTRTHSAPEWFGNPVLEVMLLDNNEPTSYGEAMVGPDSDIWLEAIKSEIESVVELSRQMSSSWDLVVEPSQLGSLKGLCGTRDTRFTLVRATVVV